MVQFIRNVGLNCKFPFIAAEEDTGPIVRALVQEAAGKKLLGYRSCLTPYEFVQAFTRATGFEAKSIELSKDQLDQLPPELKIGYEESLGYFNEFGYDGGDPEVIHLRDVSWPPRPPVTP